ncbi:hypothetical protein M404DRAFT_1003642 [Pisolithus tinctorius Marx 270]|uniref:Uncharacterized protein n=1 Tax=Pisolithus tinctorius Marx 270 TaxID=870435 RepID=A0A0C3JT44_PISTI|nr:hypothetical protein M404DRAFT_1003642 [Pisolithus tinctorius Marx 270]
MPSTSRSLETWRNGFSADSRCNRTPFKVQLPDVPGITGRQKRTGTAVEAMHRDTGWWSEGSIALYDCCPAFAREV